MNLANRTAGSVISLRMVRAYPVRAALVWLAVHAFAAGSLALAGDSAPFSSFGVTGTMILAGAVASTVYLDARRRRELSFLRNLGVSSWLPAAVGFCATLVMELALAAAS